MIGFGSFQTQDCHGLTRRAFLQAGATLPFALEPTSNGRAVQAAENAKAKSVLLIWLGGGPSHLDLFDPKPEVNRFAGQTCGKTVEFESLAVDPFDVLVVSRELILRAVTEAPPGHDPTWWRGRLGTVRRPRKAVQGSASESALFQELTSGFVGHRRIRNR